MSNQSLKKYRLTNPITYRAGFKEGSVYLGYLLRGIVWLKLDGEEYTFHPAELTEVRK